MSVHLLQKSFKRNIKTFMQLFLLFCNVVNLLIVLVRRRCVLCFIRNQQFNKCDVCVFCVVLVTKKSISAKSVILKVHTYHLPTIYIKVQLPATYVPVIQASRWAVIKHQKWKREEIYKHTLYDYLIIKSIAT